MFLCFAVTTVLQSALSNTLAMDIVGLTYFIVLGLTWLAPGTDWTQSIIFAILILILVFRPEGILGERTPEGG